MLGKNDKIDELFEKFDNQWDIYEPDEDHYDRFIAKQQQRKSKQNRRVYLSIAATVLVLLGCFTFFNHNKNHQSKSGSMEFASRQTRETDSVFTAMINIELQKVKDKKNPMNEQIVTDALKQMKTFDADYQKIKIELIKNGESKQLIYAMLRNLKTRISFLENVLNHIEDNEKINTTTNESTT